jgi:hypothetical protein
VPSPYQKVVLFNDSLAIIGEQNTSETQVLIYPNPFHSSTNLYFPDKWNMEDIYLFFNDPLGRRININVRKGDNHIEIFKDNISKGIYFVNIYSRHLGFLGVGKIVVE